MKITEMILKEFHFSKSYQTEQTEGPETSINEDDHLVEIQDNNKYDMFSTSNISSESSTFMVKNPETSSRCLMRNRKPKEFLDFITFQTVCPNQKPTSVEKGLHGKGKCKWKDAMKCKYYSII